MIIGENQGSKHLTQDFLIFIEGCDNTYFGGEIAAYHRKEISRQIP